MLVTEVRFFSFQLVLCQSARSWCGFIRLVSFTLVHRVRHEEVASLVDFILCSSHWFRLKVFVTKTSHFSGIICIDCLHQSPSWHWHVGNPVTSNWRTMISKEQFTSFVLSLKLKFESPLVLQHLHKDGSKLVIRLSYIDQAHLNKWITLSSKLVWVFVFWFCFFLLREVKAFKNLNHWHSLGPKWVFRLYWKT